METCNPTKAEMKITNGIMDNTVTRIRTDSTNKYTKRVYILISLLYMKTKTWNRINYANRIAKQISTFW